MRKNWIVLLVTKDGHRVLYFVCCECPATARDHALASAGAQSVEGVWENTPASRSKIRVMQ